MQRETRINETGRTKDSHTHARFSHTCIIYRLCRSTVTTPAGPNRHSVTTYTNTQKKRQRNTRIVWQTHTDMCQAALRQGRDSKSSSSLGQRSRQNCSVSQVSSSSSRHCTQYSTQPSRTRFARMHSGEISPSCT